MKRLVFVLQFVPLSVFVAIARAKGFTINAWGTAFIIGGSIAVLETLFFLITRLPLNRLVVGVNLYLALGGLGFILEDSWIWRTYGQLRESALFMAIFIVGVVTTILAPTGYIEAAGASREEVKKYSLYLLIGTAFCIGCSVVFRGNVWLSGALPFILLLIIRRGLQRKLTEPERMCLSPFIG